MATLSAQHQSLKKLLSGVNDEFLDAVDTVTVGQRFDVVSISIRYYTRTKCEKTTDRLCMPHADGLLQTLCLPRVTKQGSSFCLRTKGVAGAFLVRRLALHPLVTPPPKRV